MSQSGTWSIMSMMFPTLYLIKLFAKILILSEVLREFGGCKDLYPTTCSIATQWTVYSVKDGRKFCRDCHECPSGSEVFPPCGTNITNKTVTTCRSCEKGITFSASKGIGPCKLCNICGENKIVQQECEKNQDRVCGGCIKGFYHADNGDCLPCQPCCNNQSEKHKKCVEDGDKHCMADSRQCDLAPFVIEVPKNSSNVTTEPNDTPSQDEYAQHSQSNELKKIALGTTSGIVALLAAVLLAYKLFIRRRKRQSSIPEEVYMTPGTSCTTLAVQETQAQSKKENSGKSTSISGKLVSRETGGASSSWV